jgi:hypothetical protein
MAENKTKPTTISVPAFLDACIDEERRTDAKVLAKLMQRITGNKPAMWGSSNRTQALTPRRRAVHMTGV